MRGNQATRRSNQVRFQMDALRDEIERESADIARRRARREVIAGRPVRDEARRARFLRRLDNEIRAAEERRAMAEANLAGLGGDLRA